MRNKLLDYFIALTNSSKIQLQEICCH